MASAIFVSFARNVRTPFSIATKIRYTDVELFANACVDRYLLFEALQAVKEEPCFSSYEVDFVNE